MGLRLNDNLWRRWWNRSCWWQNQRLLLLDKLALGIDEHCWLGLGCNQASRIHEQSWLRLGHHRICDQVHGSIRSLGDVLSLLLGLDKRSAKWCDGRSKLCSRKASLHSWLASHCQQWLLLKGLLLPLLLFPLALSWFVQRPGCSGRFAFDRRYGFY